MPPLDLSDNQTIIAIGLSVVVFVFVLRRLVLRTASRNRHVTVSQTPAEIDAAENTATALVEQLEVRLYDFAREVEGRIHSKIAVLDRLIINADREIIRLEQVLAESRRVGSPVIHSRQPDAIVSPAADDKEQRHAA